MDASDSHGFRRSPLWLVVLAALVACQGWLTLQLFGGEESLAQLTSDAPILDGRHPLHFYHGLLGNRVWHERRGNLCYDPAFQAGYLKTPIFDGGSRPAELFLYLGGPSAGSYKMGLAICCLFPPLAFALAARGIGLGAGGACLTALIGGTLWWSPACRALLETGDIDLLMGGICVPVYLAWLFRFGHSPGPLEWLVITVSAAICWYAQPLLMVVALPLSLLYHVWVFREMRLVWHISLLFANAIGLGVNLFWLHDWVTHIGMYVPYGGEETPPRLWPSTFRNWEAFVPADPVELGIAAIGLIGLLVMLKRHSDAAWLFGLGIAVFVSAAGAGQLWPMLAEFGTHKVMSVGVWCCALPCSYALMTVANGFANSTEVKPIGAIWLLAGLTGLAWSLDIPRRWEVLPLQIGLGADREEIVKTIRESSTSEGRILWEDRAEGSRQYGWTALLPELTQRPFLGGLTPDQCVDHLYARLADGKLMNRPIGEWSDEELHRIFQRYNVTRIVAWTSESRERLGKMPSLHHIAELKDGGVMFAIDRRPGYFLRGSGLITQMDWKRVALADLKPDADGVVVLSLHHHHQWRVTPGYVVIEKDVDVNDPIPMLRLRLPDPVARVTLTWQGN